MENFLNEMKKFAPLILRVGLALVFLWFGSQQVMHPEAWVGLIPEWVTSFSGLYALHVVYSNGAFEIIFGLCLLVGYFTRVAAFLLSIHLIGIIFSVGYNDVGVRDFGLLMSTISVFLNGPDEFSLGKFLRKDI